MKNVKRQIGEKIKAARIAAGYASQSALANAMESDQSRISRWESGLEVPAAGYQKKLAKILNVKEAELFDVQLGERPPALTRQDPRLELIRLILAMPEREALSLLKTLNAPEWTPDVPVHEIDEKQSRTRRR